MLVPKVFLYERILVIFFLLQIALRLFLSDLIIAILFVPLFIAKYKLEGFKITFPFFGMAQAILYYFPNAIVNLLVVAFLYKALYFLPAYICPDPSGPYKVGYKDLKIGKDIDIAVYYPTFETTKDVLTHEGNTLTKRNYEGARLFFNIYIPYIVPQIIHEVAFSFFWKLYLGVNKDAKIIPPSESNKFPIMVLSHGIACSKNLYTVFTKEWASQGYIVFCIDHDEEIYCNWRYPEDLVNFKRPLLKVRKDLVRKTLDYVENESNIEELFETQVNIDFERVFMVGHSFGGGTAASVVSEDKRITGGLILLDQFVNPCDESVFEKKIDLPMICLRTEEYDQIQPIREAALRYVRSQAENMVSGYFRDSFHCTQCDLILHLPQELCLWDMNGRLDNVEEQIKYHRKMINIFLETVANGKKIQSNQTIMKEVRKKIESFCETFDKKKNVFYFDN